MELVVHLLSISSLYFPFLGSKNLQAQVHKATTSDGSDTLYSKIFDSHYHSTHGARQESMHVFIQEGLQYFQTEYPTQHSIAILEIGFGTGLNALLTAKFSGSNSVKYHAIEAYPVSPEIAQELNYSSTDQESQLYRTMQYANWNEWVSLKADFQLFKEHELIEKAQYIGPYDIVYYDAFGPNSQPDLWQEDVLQPIIESLRPGGILVTFCAQGAFKRVLKKLGMYVERVPGPPGKREMTRATAS